MEDTPEDVAVENDAPPAKRQKVKQEIQEEFAAVEEPQEKKYQDFVTAEEVEKLKDFHVLDEVKSDDEEIGGDDSEDEKSEGIPEDEIDRMLDENLPEEMRMPKQKEKPYVTRQKIVLEEKGINHFEVLPLDWLVVRHYSGMPVYMHRPTRVCTLAKPYFIGKENTRRHDIPISAIPCLNYRRALQEEEKQAEIDRRIEEQIKNGTWKNNENTSEVTSTDPKVDEDKVEVSSTNNNDCVPNGENILKDKHSENDRATKNGNVFKCPYPVDQVKLKHNDQTKIVVDNKQVSNDNEIEAKSESLSFVVSQSQASVNESKSKQINEDNNVTRDIKEENEKVTADVKCTYNNKTSTLTESSEVKSNDGTEKSNVTTNNQQDAVDCISIIKGPVDDSLVEKSEVKNEARSNEVVGISNEETSDMVDKDGRDDSSGLLEYPSSSSLLGQQTEEEREQEISRLARPLVLPGGVAVAPPRVECAASSWKCKPLTPEDLYEYCRRLFKFKTINIMHFKRWADRRKYASARKSLQYPALPHGTKLITIPAAPAANGAAGGGGARRDWVMNMNGRSYLSVFHEYVRRVLHTQPVYQFTQLENSSSPYQATVYISGMPYGVGTGSSKRLAKAAAARASIHVLIPQAAQADQDPNTDPDFSFFDHVRIEDPRVPELCAAACEPAPHAVLRTCLNRNCGATPQDTQIHTELKKLEYQKVEMTMTVGKHSATVVCKNKKTAKQLASQAILQQLHPHITSWGSLLRLYGSRSVKSCKEKKQEEQEITLLQDKARRNEPNHAVLEKLRLEMRRLQDRDQAAAPKGLFRSDQLPACSGSNLNNVEL